MEKQLKIRSKRVKSSDFYCSNAKIKEIQQFTTQPLQPICVILNQGEFDIGGLLRQVLELEVIQIPTSLLNFEYDEAKLFGNELDEFISRRSTQKKIYLSERLPFCLTDYKQKNTEQFSKTKSFLKSRINALKAGRIKIIYVISGTETATLSKNIQEIEPSIKQIKLNRVTNKKVERALLEKCFVEKPNQVFLDGLVKTIEGNVMRLKYYARVVGVIDTAKTSNYIEKINFFHSLGKVLYNKRVDSDGNLKRITSKSYNQLKPKSYFNPVEMVEQLDNSFLFRLYLKENMINFVSEEKDRHFAAESCSLAENLNYGYVYKNQKDFDACLLVVYAMRESCFEKEETQSNVREASAFNFEKPLEFRNTAKIQSKADYMAKKRGCSFNQYTKYVKRFESLMKADIDETDITEIIESIDIE